MLEALNDDFTEAPLSPSELRSVIHSSGNYVEDTTALFGPPKTTEPLPMEFLYYPYIPYFGVTLLAGNPGMGKIAFGHQADRSRDLRRPLAAFR